MRRAWSHSWPLALLTILLAGLLIAVAGVASSAVALYRADWILPGVHALGRDIGGMSTGAAASSLTADWSRQMIVLEGASTRWTVPPEKLGITLDVQGVVNEAYRRGRDLHTFPEMVDALRWIAASARFDPSTLSLAWQAPLLADLSPIWRYDVRVAAETMRTIAGQLDLPPEDAAVRVVDGNVEATPAESGRALDITQTLAGLESDPWAVIRAQRLELVVAATEPTITDTSAVVEAVRPLLAGPIQVEIYDPIRDEGLTWTIEPSSLGDWVVFEIDSQDRTRLTWKLDQAALSAHLVEHQAAALGEGRFVDQGEAARAVAKAFLDRQSRVHLRAYHSPRRHTVRPGETLSSIALDYGIPYPWIQAANPDLGASLLSGQDLEIPSQDVLLPLPVVEGKRLVVRLAEQRLWAYEQGALKWEWPVSTGLPSSPTNPGIFQVQTHEEKAYAANWDLWMPWFIGIYRPVPNQDFMNGLHGFPSRDQQQLLWTNNLGRPVTYGCILLSTENAKALYDWAAEGVVVEVRR